MKDRVTQSGKGLLGAILGCGISPKIECAGAALCANESANIDGGALFFNITA